MNWVEPQVYIDLGILIDRGGIERCREPNFDRLRGIEEVLTAKIFDVSSFYQASIEQTETRFFKEEKHMR